MKIPSPHEVGLPDKFSKWRAGQEDAIARMLEGKKRVDALCMPTGAGKSPAYVAFALLSKQPTCIVTNSRGLQDQLMDDFSSIGMVDIRGRNNYECQMKEGCTCEEGYASSCGYKGTIACPSSQAEMRAASSSLVVTNYAKWCHSRKWGQGMSHFTQVIFDEGHECPQALASAMQVILHHREIEQDLKLDFLTGEEALDVANWKPWASFARATAETEMIKAQAQITGVANPKPAWVRHYTHMRNLCRRLAIVQLARANDWIVEEIEQGFQFDPIRPAKYAESALLLKVPRIIVISATLRPKTMFMTGVGKQDFDFTEYSSDFDPARCPIYWVPTMRVDSRQTDMSLLWMRIDQTLAKRQDRKGIIHTVSYARRDEVKSRSRFGQYMMVNPKGEPPTGMIDEFRLAPPGSILVSPSVGSGYDFPGKDCEFQIMCKIPFPPPSKIVKAREAADPEYRSYQAMQTMVQCFGRGMRSRSDSCESFIFDDHLEWFKPKFAHLAPSSFHAFFKKVAVLPQPPERLQ